MYTTKDINGIPSLVDIDTGEIIRQPFFKTPYNHDTNMESDRTGTMCPEKTLTNQASKDEVDINNIIKKFQAGAPLPPIPLPENFGSNHVMDQFEMRSQIAEANAVFYQLEPGIRARYSNDPAAWHSQVMACMATGDRQTLREMGLDVPEPTKPTPTPAGGSPAPAPEKEPPSGSKKGSSEP